MKTSRIGIKSSVTAFTGREDNAVQDATTGPAVADTAGGVLRRVLCRARMFFDQWGLSFLPICQRRAFHFRRLTSIAVASKTTSTGQRYQTTIWIASVRGEMAC